jgi:hypothetical protein
VTGPTSIVIAGVDARNPADGAVYVVDGQAKRRADLPGAGQLTITSVNGSLACVRDAAGRFSGIDTNAASVSPGCTPSLPSPASGGGNDPSVPSRAGGGGNGQVLAASVGPAATPTPPPPTTSYYVYGAYLAQCGAGTTTGCPLYNFGASTYSPSSAPSGLVILAFGAPCYNPNTLVYGTQLFNTYVCTPDDQLVVLAQAWIRGYESANASRTAPTILGLGSSNSITGADPPGYNLTGTQMYTAGYGWFQNLVKPVATGTIGPAPITVWAASDIEQSSPYPDGSPPDWYVAATTRPWLDGYHAAAGTVTGAKCGATTPYQMINFGDYVVPNKPGWTPADVYFLSWGAPLACALPEIYYTANATEWQSLNTWASSQPLAPIQFTGVMSEDGQGGSLLAADSWKALASATGQSPPYLTIIGTVATPVTPFGRAGRRLGDRLVDRAATRRRAPHQELHDHALYQHHRAGNDDRGERAPGAGDGRRQRAQQWHRLHLHGDGVDVRGPGAGVGEVQQRNPGRRLSLHRRDGAAVSADGQRRRDVGRPRPDQFDAHHQAPGERHGGLER